MSPSLIKGTDGAADVRPSSPSLTGTKSAIRSRLEVRSALTNGRACDRSALNCARELALADLGMGLVQLPDLTVADQLALDLQLGQRRGGQAELAQQLGGIGALGLEVDLHALQALGLLDAAGRGDLRLPRLDPGIDPVGHLGLLLALGRSRLHVEHDRLVLVGAVAAQRQRRQAVVQTGLQAHVLELQVRALQAPDRVVEVGLERRQLVEVEPGPGRGVRRIVRSRGPRQSRRPARPAPPRAPARRWRSPRRAPPRPAARRPRRSTTPDRSSSPGPSAGSALMAGTSSPRASSTSPARSLSPSLRSSASG